MSRLQVGGLAFVVKSKYEENIGRVVTLLEHVGLRTSPHDGKSYDYWRVKFSDCTALGKSMYGVVSRSMVIITPRECLMPLGDDKGVELYDLREEIMTGHDKETV